MKTSLVFGFLASLVSTTAFAQEAGVEKATEPQNKRISLGAQIELIPYGQIEAGNDDVDFQEDAAFSYGVAANLDFYLNRYLSIGFVPRLLLNVTTADQDEEQEDDDALKQLDLRARVKGEFPLGRAAHLYGYVAPGYSLIFADDNDFGPVNIDDAKGFVIAFAAGSTFDLATNLFLNAEVGYQLGFQKSSASIDGIDGDADFDFSTNSLSVGVGLGTRF